VRRTLWETPANLIDYDPEVCPGDTSGSVIPLLLLIHGPINELSSKPVRFHRCPSFLLNLLFCVWEFSFLEFLDPNTRPRNLAIMFVSWCLGLVACVGCWVSTWRVCQVASSKRGRRDSNTWSGVEGFFHGPVCWGDWKLVRCDRVRGCSSAKSGMVKKF
jgi:hypothetical protein